MPNFDPLLSDKLLGIPFAGVGTTLERNALQTLIKNLISENKYSVEYIINLCSSYGYHRKMAKEVFTELTGLSPELIVENNEYYQNPTFVPSGTIAWGFSKGSEDIAYYVVPFEYGYALNKKNQTEVPEQVAQFVDINSAVDKMKGLVKRVFTIDQIITEKLLLDEPIQSSARNPRDTEEPYFSDPVRVLKNRYIKRYMTDGEVKSEAFKLVASGEITETEGTELAKWVDLKQEKRDQEEEETVLDDKGVEFGSIKNDPKGKLQQEAQETARLKASADDETAKCFICEETYPTSELKEEEDIGLICDHCIKGMKSQGYELKLKANKQVKAAPTEHYSEEEYETIYEGNDYHITLHTRKEIPQNIGDNVAVYTIASDLGKGTRGGIIGQCVVVVNNDGYALQELIRDPEELEPAKLTEEDLWDAYSIIQKDYESRIADMNKSASIKRKANVGVNEKQYLEDMDRSFEHHFYVNEDFKSYDGDTRIAVLEEDEDGELIDWNFFDTLEEAYEFANKSNAELDKQKKSASKKIKAEEELKLEDIKEEESKTSIQKAEEDIDEMNIDELLNETTPQAFFDEEIKKDKIDNLNEKVSKIIDEFSAKFDDFDKYDVALQSYKIQMIADDKLDQSETIEDLELNAKAIIMIVLNINPKEDVTNVKKGLAIFSVNDNKTYWSGTFKSEDNKFYAFTEEGLDALYRELDTKEELVEDIVGNSKIDIK